MRTKTQQRRLLTTASTVLCLLALSQRPTHAQSFNLSVAATEVNVAPFYNNSDTYGLSWSAVVDPSSPTAIVGYTIYESFGFVDPFTGGVQISTGITSTALTLYRAEGTLCWGVQAFDFESTNLGRSVVACHPYVNSSEDGNDGGIKRVDGDGQQLGYNDIWEFSYFLDNDSIVTGSIYPSTATFSANVDGFMVPSGSSSPLYIFADHVPDSGNFDITDTWDTRDSAGVLVPNGIYFVYYSVTDVTGSLRFAGVYNVPVDLLRLLDVSATGISPTTPLGQINYTVTEAASVRVLIGVPGTVMTEDSNGNVQAEDPVTGLPTTSTNVVVQAFNFAVPSGPNTIAWNGTDQSGVPVSSGVYTIGISAVDSFGNHATDLSGNYGVIQGVIPVNRSASQTALNTTPPTITQVSVNGTAISLSGGSILTGSFSTIQITLNETAGTGNDLSQVTLSGPNGPISGGTVSSAGDVVTYSTGTLQSSTGTYTINVTAEDVDGNISAPTSYNFTLGLPPVPTVTAASVGGSAVALTGGTTLTGSFTAIAITLSVTAGTGIDQSSVTLTNPLGASIAGTVSSSSNTVTFTVAAQSSTGTYTVKIIPENATGNAGTTTTFSFALGAVSSGSPGGGSGGGSGGSGSGGSGGSGTSTPTAAGFSASLIPAPNPVKAAPATIMFTLPAPALVTVDIYTILGRRVFHATASYATAGAQTFSWPLVNDAATLIANGVYLVKVSANTGSSTVSAVTKLMVLR